MPSEGRVLCAIHYDAATKGDNLAAVDLPGPAYARNQTPSVDLHVPDLIGR